MMNITSTSNDRIKYIKKLIKSSGERKDAGVYIVEGIRMFREIPKEDVISVYVSDSFYENNREIVSKYDKELFVVRDDIFTGISATGTPQGILALVSMKTYTLDDVFSKEELPFIIIAEHLQDPGNVGTIIRTAEGAGATGIILSSDSADIYNPKVVRSTMGSIFRVPVYVSDNLPEDIDKIKARGVTIYGAHLRGKDFYEKDFKRGCGFLVGNEGNGLSREISDKADDLIKIPMKGKVESLNVAASVAVISYEVLRQRI